MIFKGRKTPDKPKEFVDILPSKVKYNDITAKVDVNTSKITVASVYRDITIAMITRSSN